MYFNLLIFNSITRSFPFFGAGFMANHFSGPNRLDDADFRPVRYRDMLPLDHPARDIETFVAHLDLSLFKARYKVGDGLKGRAPREIRMILGVILYAIYQRTYSARQIDYATQHQADFWFFTYGERISHDKISDFINLHEHEVHSVFMETILLAQQNDLLDFKGVYQDGYLLKANASKKRNRHMEDLPRQERRLSDRLTAIMEELKDKQIAPCLEQEKSRVESKLAKIGRLRERLNEKIGFRSNDKAPWKAKEIAASTVINETDPDADLMKQKNGSYDTSYLKVSATDAKADIVVASDVDGHYDEPHKALPLFKVANENCSGLGHYDTMLADSNFTSAENCQLFEEAGIALIGPTRNHEHDVSNPEEAGSQVHFTYDEAHRCMRCSEGAVLSEEERYFDKHKQTTIVVFSNKLACPECQRLKECTSSKYGYRRVKMDVRFPAQQRVLQRYCSPEGKLLYKKRSHTAETPQGDLKHNGRFLQLLRRGLKKVRVDSTLQDIVWNLRRIFNTTGGAIIWST